MSSSDLSPEAIKLLNRMTGPPLSHPSFTGEPIDLAQIDPLSLGDLWTIAHATNRWENNRPIKSLAAETASSILKLGEKMEPAFRGAAARDYLDFLSDKLEREPARASGYVADFDWKEACFCLTRCIDLSFDGLGAAAKRFLAAADWQVMPHLAVALARLVDDEFGARALEKLAADLADSPFLVQELRTITALDLRANLAVAEVAQVNYPELQEADPAISGGHYRLSDIPAYVAFAEEGLKEAAARVRKIHNGEVPYASDKAFTLKDRDVIARLVRVALDRDAAWLPPVLDELFRKVSLAPTAAKSLPSQSVSIALGHAVEAFPTPEAVATLRGVLAIIRHAGVQKKLKRNLNGAERGLADRPEVALRLLDGQQISKAQLKTLARCLEAGFASHMSLKYEDWRARLAGHPQGKALTRSLIWRILDSSGGGVGVLPVIERSEVRLQDVSGSTVSAAPDSRIMLWHPSVATEAERNAWRDRIADLQIKQPFKQAFREHYVLLADELSETNTAMFSGHGVSIVPFLGLARQERWKLEYEALTRSFGQWTARLDVDDDIFPGCTGATRTRHVSVWRQNGKKALPVALRDVPPVTLSEILRAVDLLVSTSGFALTSDEDRQIWHARLHYLATQPLGAMAEMRKEALARALRGLIAGLQFDARHLRLGAYAIHLATGRVTCNGEPIEVELPKHSNLAAVPWLPYDEKLLDAIFHTAVEIAERLKAQSAHN